MNIGEKYFVTIEKLTNLGFGLTRIGGVVVFVQNACPEDELEIEITRVTKSYANAKIVKIIAPSPSRIEPFCPMYKVCGACQIQHIDYNRQLELKREIVEDAMLSIGGININIPLPVKSPETKNFRRKIQYPISQTKNSKRILAGYFKPESHEIVNIKYCPIQPEICDSIIEFIRENAPIYGVDGYRETTHSGLLRHVIIRNSAANGENLVVLVVNDTKISTQIKNLSQAIFENFKEVSGVCVNFNPKRTNVITGEKSECVVGNNYIIEKLLDKNFKIGAQTFFQVNPLSAENIFSYVKNYIKDNFNSPLVLDAYAGISAFGICLSDVSSLVVTIEENSQSVELAKESALMNNISNIEIHGGDAGKYFARENRKFDVIILDPPRKGCSKQSLDESLRLCKGVIVYVSCNPATLARDLKYLTMNGATVQSVQPFDMFCHSYHIENVAIISCP